METVTRDQIREKLREWKAGAISAEAVQAWASDRWLSDHFSLEDWEYDEVSVSNEVLAALDMLDMNLTTEADADTFIEFLDTPSGSFSYGYNKMKERIQSVDFEARMKTLRGVQPYAPFIK